MPTPKLATKLNCHEAAVRSAPKGTRAISWMHRSEKILSVTQKDLTKGVMFRLLFVVIEINRRRRPVARCQRLISELIFSHYATTLRICQAICQHELCIRYA